MHIEALGNGLGGQSMYCLWLACQKKIPATVSITADTGWENDCLWNTGERTTAREYFERIVKPMVEAHGIEARFARAVDGKKEPKMPLGEYVKAFQRGEVKSIHIPLYGSKGGQLPQTCTDNWKIKAIKDELRRMGATTARTAQGIHADEWLRRVRGLPLGKVGDWKTYQTGFFVQSKDSDAYNVQLDIFGGETRTQQKTRVFQAIKWMTHYYPLAEMRLNRQDIRNKLDALRIPYLLSSECDGCPHKNWERWDRTSHETIKEIAEIEEGFNGEYFFTPSRKPFLIALEEMRQKNESGLLELEEDFGCENHTCGI